MAYLTAQMVQDFCGKFVEESDTIALDCARAAMETIEKYLGYNPESETKTVTVYGAGSNTLCVPGWITELTSIEGFEDVSGFETFKNYIQFRKPAEYFERNKEYKITFKSGFVNVPMKIVLVAKQLASLYWESSGGNLAVSSTSFADTGTRVFNNFSEDRFLKDIDDWRIRRI